MPPPEPRARLQASTPGKFVKAAEYVEVYANNARFSVTLGDFLIRFGVVVQDDIDTESSIEESVGVRLSPQSAKMLLVNLMSVMQQWEALFGEITTRSPEELASALAGEPPAPSVASA